MQVVELEAYSSRKQTVMVACTVVAAGEMERCGWGYETKIGGGGKDPGPRPVHLRYAATAW